MNKYRPQVEPTFTRQQCQAPDCRDRKPESKRGVQSWPLRKIAVRMEGPKGDVRFVKAMVCRPCLIRARRDAKAAA